MNPSQSKTARYVIATFCALALLLVIGWLALRESPPPSPDLPPVSAVSVSPRISLPAPDKVAPHETSTNQVAESAPIPTNAATVYRQAFALYDALSKEDKDLIGNWRTNVDSSVAADLCEKIQPICDLVHQAAAATNCDWGVEQPMTGKTFLTHLNPCRSLARAAVWSAAHCRANDPSAAADDLLATSRLGQNAALTSAMMGHLVNLSIQQMVIDSATMQLSALARDPRLAQLFDDANYDEGLRRAYEQEADMISNEADRLAALPPEQAVHELLLPMAGDSSDSQIQRSGLAQAIKDMHRVSELDRQLADALELPEAEYREWLKGLDAVRKTNSYVAIISPPEILVNKTQAMTVRNAMAAAALAVMRDGTDALQSHPDPTTGQPFTYRQTPDGFELESSFQFQDKSLKSSFK